MKLLKETCAKINELDEAVMQEAKARQDSLTKPPGSLGKLEDIAIKLAGMSGSVFNKVDNKVHIVMAGDHGVVEEGVSAFPQEVTPQMVLNFVNGGAAINVLANQVGAEVKIVDMGVATDLESDKVINKKIRKGTDNMVKGPAMSREEAIAALEAGIEVVNKEINSGANLIGTGEMGIGNTTPSSAIIATVTDIDLNKLVGPGTGIDSERLEHKKEVIKKAVAINDPDVSDGIDILSAVGGFEIGGMAGVMIGAAAHGVPVIVDGLISAAAALIATRIHKDVFNYLLPSHRSTEPGHINILEEIGLEPILDLNMRLGEGTGAVLAMDVVEAATRIIEDMATFEEASVSNKG